MSGGRTAITEGYGEIPSMTDAIPANGSPPDSGGAPPWVMTFADLMSLLMCFFVLLLSFSEMDALKFKQIAGSMQFAFGVQREIKAMEIPKGTSIVAKEFSPGKPEPTVRNEIRQHTTDDNQRNLKVHEDKQGNHDAGEGGEQASEEEVRVEIKKVYVEQAQADAAELRNAFAKEIAEGFIEVETDEERIIIRIQEKGSFASGSAELIGDFQPIIAKISDVLKTTEGDLIVAGHTDDIPISTARFRSNWELSAVRAVSVLHHVLAANAIPEGRFIIEGYADSRPLAPNESGETRARNRRVEIIVVKGRGTQAGALDTIFETLHRGEQ